MATLRRLASAAAISALCSAPLAAQEDASVSADSVVHPVEAFVTDLADPLDAGFAVFLGLYDHARNAPDEWGGGFDALAQRVVSRAGGHVIGTSVRHGMAAALGRSTAYEPCGCTGTGARVGHVFVETFTDRDRSGRRVFSEPYLAGTLAASLAPAAWHPDVSLRDGLKGSAVSVLFTLASRIALELVPVP